MSAGPPVSPSAGPARAAPGGQPPTGGGTQVAVSVAADRTAVTVGDPITLTYTVRRPQGVEILSLDADRSLDVLTLLDRKEGTPRALPDGRVEEVRTVTLAAYETGTKEIPALAVTYRDASGTEGRVSTEPLRIEVASVLAAGQTEPADIKAPAAMPERIVWPWIAAGAALLLAAAYLFWRRRRRKVPEAAPAPAAPPRPAYEIAYEELERLLASDRLARGAIKEFYIELAEIMRRYLEARYGVDTFERTTGEILEALRAVRVAVKAAAMTGDLLQACDLVKFAKHRPAEEETRRAVEAAYRLVDETKPISAPVEALAPAAAAAGGAR